MSLRCDAVCEGGVREGTMLFPPLSSSFQSLPPLPTIKLHHSGADSCVGGLVYVLELCGSLQQTLLRMGVSLAAASTPTVFSIRGLRLYLPRLEPRVAGLSCSPIVPPSLSTWECGTARSSSYHLTASPLCPAACLCPSCWPG